MSSWALPHPILSPSLCLLAARSIQENLNHTYEVTPALPTVSLHLQPLLSPKPSIYLTTTVSIFRFQSHLNQRGEKVKRKKKNRNGIILPSKRQSLPPAPASPVRASPCAPSIWQEIWVILTPISSSHQGGPQVLLAPSSRKWHQPLSSWLTLLPPASTLILSFQDSFNDLWTVLPVADMARLWHGHLQCCRAFFLNFSCHLMDSHRFVYPPTHTHTFVTLVDPVPAPLPSSTLKFPTTYRTSYVDVPLGTGISKQESASDFSLCRHSLQESLPLL